MPGSINQSVGTKGSNREADVRLVQSLLNDALKRYPKFAASGVEKLEVDGVAGVRTNDAIVRFQAIVMG